MSETLLLHFVDDVKCILARVRLSVSLSLAAFPHYFWHSVTLICALEEHLLTYLLHGPVCNLGEY